MSERERVMSAFIWKSTGWLAVAVFMSVSTLGFLGYQGIREWQRSARLLADRRSEQAADLFLTALSHDMRGVQASVLSSSLWDEFSLNPPYDAKYLVASAFARYPYPELFFGWRGVPTPDSVVFFARSDRYPAWMPVRSEPVSFPVVVGAHQPLAARLANRIASDTTEGRRFSIFDLEVGKDKYQVIALVVYRDERREEPAVVFGFMVNLEWVRGQYFPDLAVQLTPIVGPDVQLLIGDGSQPSAGAVSEHPTARRVVPVAFFDPLLVATDPPDDLSRTSLVARAAVVEDPILRSATQGANRSLSIAALATVVFALGMMLTVRSTRIAARLADMRSEFVSAVTHELKTPIASIRALGETLVSGRVRDFEASKEYAQLVVREAKRLTRLVDNLLAYARITDVTEVYSFEPTSLKGVVEHSIQEFAGQLEEGRFEVEVEIPAALPPVWVDRTAIGLLLDNLVDNAIRYSRERRWLKISARVDGGEVIMDVVDRGTGIGADEIEHVRRKFFRGREAGSGGSGLGLAIAERIAIDHRGSLAIQSSVGEGTTVSLRLPVAERAS